MKRTLTVLLGVVLLLAAPALANRELTATDTTKQGDLVDKSQTVHVTIQNGFARTEVVHVFENRGGQDLEATYAFPVPISASLSELSILRGEEELKGEVLPRKEAQQIYEEERAAGNDTAIAGKESYQRYTFAVSPVRAGEETAIRFVYYQPLVVDTGIVRYLYPLEDGGTDEGKSFWTREVTLQSDFSINVEVKSAWPVADVRVPSAGDAKVEMLEDGHWKVGLTRPGETLDRDFVLYYRLADDLPGRVELIPYRSSADAPGTFLMLMTPGIDLAPITGGADYTYVLDVPGSMAGKIGTLAQGVVKAIEQFRPADRFRVIAFSDNARWVVREWTAATPDNVSRATKIVTGLQSGGSTNLFDGLALAMKGLDDDRAQSVILVTDGVTNTGIVDPAKFHELARKVDVRVFGFLLGNAANWPLMKTVCDASGGFWDSVSNVDDILGKLMLAKSKITNECLHDAVLSVSGVKIYDTTELAVGKIYRGQQLAFFGRYTGAGQATVTLKTRQTGEDRTYKTSFDFPEVDTANPEIERLWAQHRIEAIEAKRALGATDDGEAATAIRDLGVAYQLVTDETSMLVLTDQAFSDRGIERRNRDRVATERQAQAVRASRPAVNRRVDTADPMYSRPAPGLGGGGGGGGGRRGGGGALDPFSVGLALALAAAGLAARRGRKRSGEV